MVRSYTTRKTASEDFGKQEHVRDEEPADRNYGHRVVSGGVGPLEIGQLKIPIFNLGSSVTTRCIKSLY